MIHLKTAAEIEAMARAGAILGRLYEVLPERVTAGASTADLDAFAEDFIRSHPGAEPAFKGLYGFPATLCISLNHEVVHGIPRRERVLEEGDLVSIDAGVKLEGWFADAAITVPVGAVDAEAEQLVEVTREALGRGIAHASEGNRLGDIGHAIQAVVEDAGFGVVRDLVGHGLGREPHEEPQVPNYGQPGRGIRLREGMVLAIEPMVTQGSPDVRTLPDRWTVITVDRRRAAHFEHTVAITADGPKILTQP